MSNVKNVFVLVSFSAIVAAVAMGYRNEIQPENLVAQAESIVSCGSKYATLRYLDASGSMKEKNIFHGNFFADGTGAFYQAPGQGEACKARISDYKVLPAMINKLSVDGASATVEATMGDGRSVTSQVALSPKGIEFASAAGSMRAGPASEPLPVDVARPRLGMKR